MLPGNNPNGTRERLEAALVAAKEGREDDARSLLEGVLKDEERWCAEVGPLGCPTCLQPSQRPCYQG